MNEPDSPHDDSIARLDALATTAERLLDEGDAALSELLDAHPGADRQQLRQLVRSALDERRKDKPPRAYRELYRAIRELE